LPAHAPALAPGRPVLVLSFHYGQGLWLLHWLAAHGVPPRFVSIRLERAQAAGALQHAYARLRMHVVERLSGRPPIYTGGARGEIAATLARGGAVFGLVDVPVPNAAEAVANAELFAHPVLLPQGLLESARDSDAQVLVLTSRVAADGTRIVETETPGSVAEVTIAGLARLFERRLREAPPAWHFWHLWPLFRARAQRGSP
jgi:lauroyl/myristoyl acyltransferase